MVYRFVGEATTLTFVAQASLQKTASTTRETSVAERQTLRDSFCAHLQAYFDELGEEIPGGLYELVLAEIESPLFEQVLLRTRGNVSLAARMLGIHRSTLRRKLLQYHLI